jgi:hypothetical protein
MNHTALRALTASLVVASATVALGGCMVASPQPAVYGQYGYATVAAPNTVYYQGGNYGGAYYRPGYYARSAPFIAQPQYVQPQYVQPQFVRPQPVYYQQPGVVVNGGAGVPYGGVQGTVIVR